MIARFVLALVLVGNVSKAQAPDIRSVPPDLSVPALSSELAPGKRCLISLDGRIPCAVYLPSDWTQEQTLPLIIELPGNGGYRSPHGDVCTGRPEGCSFGYGLTGGRGAIWIAAPFMNGSGDDIAITWWGDKPSYNPKPTIDALHRIIDHAVTTWGADSNRVVLTGFSRGAIAAHAIGLHDDRIAKRWSGFILYSHCEGIWNWPYPNSRGPEVIERLRRLGDRPELILQEGTAETVLNKTRSFLESTGVKGNWTYLPTGFRNHNDTWILRPSPARTQTRTWLAEHWQE